VCVQKRTTRSETEKKKKNDKCFVCYVAFVFILSRGVLLGELRRGVGRGVGRCGGGCGGMQPNCVSPKGRMTKRMKSMIGLTSRI